MNDTAGRERRAAAREIMRGYFRQALFAGATAAARLNDAPSREIDGWTDAFVSDLEEGLSSAGYQITPTDAASAAGSVTLSVDQADDCLDAVEQVVTTFAQAGYREDHGAYTAFRELAEYLRNAIAAAESAEASGEARDGD